MVGAERLDYIPLVITTGSPLFECVCRDDISMTSNPHLPHLIDGLELCSLVWQLLLDVFRAENCLEIHPVSLDGHPFVQGFAQQPQAFFPLFHLRGIKECVRALGDRRTIVYSFHSISGPNCEPLASLKRIVTQPTVVCIPFASI